MGRLDGRVAIVTGAARGLGAAAAEALAREGASVMLTDVMADVEATAARLASEGLSTRHCRHDVTSDADWQAVVEATGSAFGAIHVLVNNAGINLPGTIESIDVDDAKRVMEVNYFGAMRGIKAVLPSIRTVGHGSIINISSNSTRMIIGLTTAYAPAKAALALLTKNVAVSCAQAGDDIRCNSIHPGPHETAMLLGDELGADRDAAIQLIQPMIAAIPMGRMGKPIEVGKAVCFLASSDSSYITGAEIFVDGGLSLL